MTIIECNGVVSDMNENDQFYVNEPMTKKGFCTPVFSIRQVMRNVAPITTLQHYT